MKVERIHYAPIPASISAEELVKESKGTVSSNAVIFEGGHEKRQNRRGSYKDNSGSPPEQPPLDVAHDKKKIPTKTHGMDVIA